MHSSEVRAGRAASPEPHGAAVDRPKARCIGRLELLAAIVAYATSRRACGEAGDPLDQQRVRRLFTR